MPRSGLAGKAPHLRWRAAQPSSALAAACLLTPPSLRRTHANPPPPPPQAVPDTWGLINSDDVVTAAGKVGARAGPQAIWARHSGSPLSVRRPPPEPRPTPLSPQFVTLYSRTGHKVLVNKLGDMVGECAALRCCVEEPRAALTGQQAGGREW